jgi:hypothetical protein
MKRGLLTLALLLVACDSISPPGPLNQNPPTYLKSLTVYREGYDGLVIYFVLADANGQPTAASGQFHLEIQDSRGTVSPLFMFSKPFTASQFSRATVGQGPYARGTILFSFGRIPYSAFIRTTSEQEVYVELTVYASAAGTFKARERMLLR